MPRSRNLLPSFIFLVPFLLLPMNMQARSLYPLYSTETSVWSASERAFEHWALAGVALSAAGGLVLDSRLAHEETDPFGPGGYKGGNFYNGGRYLVGEATSPAVTAGFAFSEVVASWNAGTPAATWIEAQVRVRVAGRWTRWYSVGVWASGKEAVTRHSVSGQANSDAYVDVDTLKIGTPRNPGTATAYQLKIRLFTAERGGSPSLANAAVVISGTRGAPAEPSKGDPSQWGKRLQVPECSQMIYPDGGEVWCSPTSVAMVISYWENRFGSCAADVHAAAEGVYDRVYKGHGNWPFNTAYASSAGVELEAYVSRFTSMAVLERWISAGVPVIMSIGWERDQLNGAPIPSSSGHLIVLVGFDAQGNPIVNDPAAATNVSVQRTYLRNELERAWLESSGGTVYLIYPARRAVPGQ